METITKLPEGEHLIGIRSILKGIKEKTIVKVVFAKNCPDEMKEEVIKTKIETFDFEFDQRKLGTSVGKPFPVAMVGFKK